jgi:hypothetical protein
MIYFSLVSILASILASMSWLVFMSSFISFRLVSTLAQLVLISLSRSAIICSIFAVWRYNYQDPMQCPIQLNLTPFVTC